MITKELVDRINELAKKSKTVEGLTDAELAEQKQLRADYVKAFRENLRGQLESIKIQNPDGSFKHTEFSTGIPDGLTQPGYTDTWKEAVVHFHGDVIEVK